MDDNMNIRLMTIDDYEKVYSLWMSCKGVGLNNLEDSKEGIERFLCRNPDTCFVAEIDNVIIGAILTGNDGKLGYIYHTTVNPKYWRQGIGKKLVETSIDVLKKIGISRVGLVVFNKNEIGNAFWEKMGFTMRNDLLYRNKELAEIVKIHT